MTETNVSKDLCDESMLMFCKCSGSHPGVTDWAIIHQHNETTVQKPFFFTIKQYDSIISDDEMTFKCRLIQMFHKLYNL